MTDDLFPDAPGLAAPLWIGTHAVLLRRFALDLADRLLDDIGQIALAAPWRHMVTPGGQSMSVATTSCGDLGWVSDARGYRYVHDDPLSQQPWPPIPRHWLDLAARARLASGLFTGCAPPDACLINRYAPGTRLSLHQDRDERDFSAPIISVSLGVPARFMWGGLTRGERHRTIPLEHGDVLLWGGEDRLRFHGVMPVAEGYHPRTEAFRYNITMRRAG